VTAKSDLVSVRCLDLEVLKPISTSLKGPFFTTSLNVSGEPAIASFLAAQAFQRDYAKEADLIGNSLHNLSGESSTIVFFRENTFEIIRAGSKIEEIKTHLKRTGIKTTGLDMK
jgi:tRNA A37 threonylcarbamoyladenosine synthetase subunit TsaC/SUA5/YrdC